MIERHIERRNRVMEGLDKKIAQTEEKIWKLRKRVSRLEEQLRRQRIRRENAEIRCFKEIKKIHNQISRLTHHQVCWDHNSDRTDSNELD